MVILSIMTEDQAANAFAGLANRTRLRLFRLLVRAGESGLNVGEIQRLLDIPASTLSHHLAALMTAGLIVQERHGREVISRADFDGVRRMVGYLTDECCKGVDLTMPGSAA
jgi:ArsR family transcriptional regulator, arsenate/arsenite/antimonite-responsive transcriptional repressor